MREIKFRAWDKKKKEMITKMYIKRINIYEETLNNLFEDKDVVFMQYTGLKDINGKEIYEGDIIKNPHGKSVIEYIYSSFHPLDESDGYNSGYKSEEVEVIGNIYENPELLTK